MKTNIGANNFFLISVVAIGLIGVLVLSRFLENNRPQLPESYIDQDLAIEGAKLQKYAVGLNGLIADWYWILALQYVGNKIIDHPEMKFTLDDMKPLNPRLLYPYLDSATTLDPRFTPAYAYGATVLPAIDPQQAIAILEKGIANNPKEWVLYHYLGFIHWRLKNYEKATEAYDAGAAIQEAPEWMQMMAAQMRTEGGSRATARAIYLNLLGSSDEKLDANIKGVAKLRIQELDSLEEREKIQQALNFFTQQNSRCAKNWREIFPFLQQTKLPNGREFIVDSSGNLVDPTTTPYVLDSINCKVNLNPASKIPQ